MDERLLFLDRAAKTYAAKAPALSAYLMLERATVANDHGVEESKKGPGNACRACGTISIPGVTTKISMKGVSLQENTGGKVSSRSSSSTTKYLETQCLACHRVYRTAISPSKRHSPKDRPSAGIPPKSNIARSSAGNVAPSLSAHATPLVTSSSSKQRAKARKKGGLHALVEKSKQRNQADSASGLDLMDFMKEA